eukprot:TRINITY_DN3050_c0_g3_i1.p1 TRINITY_DN3050_c0_g3~~TRINITY_DN3050_c0_g3_i1.p1  ORF type:complete len:250 (+),score=82.18 TRINITY_DN3050_c0_g3_i1:101-850(+)
MPIIYSVVARGNIILAECMVTSGNFPTITLRILSKLPINRQTRMSYDYDKYMFHCQTIFENNEISSLENETTENEKELLKLTNFDKKPSLTFICMTDSEFNRKAAFLFLQDISQRFKATYGNRAYTASTHAMNEEFSRTLQSQMAYFSSALNTDKFQHIKAEIDEVKGVMVKNIEHLLSRAEKMEILVDKTEDLENLAIKYASNASSLKRDMWWKNFRLTLILGLVVLFLIYFVLSIVCGGLLLPYCTS